MKRYRMLFGVAMLVLFLAACGTPATGEAPAVPTTEVIGSAAWTDTPFVHLEPQNPPYEITGQSSTYRKFAVVQDDRISSVCTVSISRTSEGTYVEIKGDEKLEFSYEWAYQYEVFDSNHSNTMGSILFRCRSDGSVDIYRQK